MNKHARMIREALVTPSDSNNPDCYDPHLVAEFVKPMDGFCRHYFRQEVQGIDLVPRGKTLIVGNHNAGITFIEAFGMFARFYLERDPSEIIHPLAHDTLMKLPYLNNLLAKLGSVRANAENAQAIFARNRKIFVCPGGNLEAYRPYRDRRKVNLANRKGFIKLALTHRVSISPVIFLGGHETFFVLNDGRFLAKLLRMDRAFRLDTWPLVLSMPWGLTLGPMFHWPLPVKCVARFLEPMSLEKYSPEDVNNKKALEEIYRKVTGRMQRALTAMYQEKAS
ncbi:lysophospholipid acyltransferase family protein [Bdellovibrionota bacterium FG-2]